jgi:hypothetical protein
MSMAFLLFVSLLFDLTTSLFLLLVSSKLSVNCVLADRFVCDNNPYGKLRSLTGLARADLCT